jgi:hypothetical protein
MSASLTEPLSPNAARGLLRAELERGSWRYRVRAQNVYAVVSFRSDSSAIVVTAWRSIR